MDIIKDILALKFEDTDLWLPILIGLAIFSALIMLFRYLSNKEYPLHIKLVITLIGIALVVLEFNLMLYNWRVLHLVSGLLLSIPIAVTAWKYFSMQKNLHKVKYLAEPKNIDFNIVAAWELLQSLSLKDMVPKQRKRYKRYRLFLLIKLGKISAVDSIINEFKEDKAYYHLMQHIKCLSMGIMEDAANEIKLAEEAYTADTDPGIYVQILSNRGTSHVGVKNYKVADDYFYKAIKYYKKHKLRNRELLGTLYYNYAFNKIRLGGDTWKDVLEEYKSNLNPKNLNDSVAYFNTKMELLLQTNADRTVIEKTVQESFAQIMKYKFPTENRVIFASSVARVVWAARINPSACLKTLTNNMETILSLPMPARYNAFKNIYLLFMDLHGDVAQMHDKLKEMAYQYMLNQAEKDLESYRKRLPEEAVLEKCFCHMELAGLQKKTLRGYNFNKVFSYLNNAINLYHENSLLVDEHICRMAIMDELCSPENLDEDYKITKPKEMRHQLNEIEAFLPLLREHPALAEFYLRLSFYCLHLDDYDKCAMYYNRFVNTQIALEHFAPWLRRYYMVTSFSVRAIYFMKAIKSIKKSKRLLKYVPEIQEWFRTYPNHDGMLDSTLLGKFLGYTEGVPLKIKTWIDPDFNRCESPRNHHWLWLHMLNINIDITYAQFTNDEHPNRIFHDKNRHPFETNKSYKISADGATTGLFFKGAVLKLFFEKDFSPDQRKIYDSLYSIITSNVDPKCPPLERLSQLYVDTMLPVKAIRSDISREHA